MTKNSKLIVKQVKSAIGRHGSQKKTLIGLGLNKINKEVNVNLIILRLDETIKLEQELESYLIGLNKKVLLISNNKLQFSTNEYVFCMKRIIGDAACYGNTLPGLRMLFGSNSDFSFFIQDSET